MVDEEVPVRSRREEVVHLVGLLARTPFGRWVVVAPAALSLIANLDGIGALASAITSHWRRVLWRIGEPLEDLVGLNPFVGMGLVMIFFLPFILVGVRNVIRGDVKAVSALTAAGAVFSVPLAMGVLTPTLWPNVGWFTLFSMAVSGGVVLGVYLLFRYGARRARLGQRAEFLALPAAMGLLMGGGMAIYRDGLPWWTLALGVLVIAAPLLAPTRLIQVVVVAAGIAVISLANDSVRSFLGGA